VTIKLFSFSDSCQTVPGVGLITLACLSDLSKKPQGPLWG